MPQPTILIVDDEPHTVKLIQFCLRTLPAALLSANDGATALEIMRKQPVHLVLFDVQMKGIDGLSAVKTMMTEPNLRPIPVILMTAGGDAGIEEAGLALGIKAFFRKPFSPVSLRTKIQELLKC